MSEWIELAKEGLKLAVKPRYSFSIWVGCLFILTLPLPDFLKLDPIRDEFGKYLGLVCLLALILWLVEMTLFAWSKWQDKQTVKKAKEELLKPLNSLTKGEAAVLLRAVKEKARTIRLYMESTDAASLVSKGLIEKVPYESRFSADHPYNVIAIVWERINEAEMTAILREKIPLDIST